MSVSVMDVGEVRMGVHKRLVPVRMAVRLLTVPRDIVRVLVMLVVTVAVLVFERFVFVRVFVALAQVQPDADCHQHAGNPEREARPLGKQQQR